MVIALNTLMSEDIVTLLQVVDSVKRAANSKPDYDGTKTILKLHFWQN
jgi:hypothetical protein